MASQSLIAIGCLLAAGSLVVALISGSASDPIARAGEGSDAGASSAAGLALTPSSGPAELAPAADGEQPVAGSPRGVGGRDAIPGSAPRERLTGAQLLAQHVGWAADDPRVVELEDWWGRQPDLEAAFTGEGAAAPRFAQANEAADVWRAELLAHFGKEAAQRVAAAIPLRRFDPETGDLVRVGADGKPLPHDPLLFVD